MSPVSSSMKATAVSGERIVPPIIAAMLIMAPEPASPGWIQCASTAPNAPPMMSSGASTPPEVPEPSAIAQMSALTTSSPRRKGPLISPRSSSEMVS